MCSCAGQLWGVLNGTGSIGVYPGSHHRATFKKVWVNGGWLDNG